MRLSWPIVGRSHELRTIETALTTTDVSGVLLCGPTGVGKSRIAREALASAASRGCHTRWAVGTTSARGIPLGAFAAWAPSGASDTIALLRGVLESLTAAPSGVDVVIGVDDYHLLDDLSTFVVQQLVARDAAKLILTVRESEPVAAHTQDVLRAGHFERLGVRPLTLDETTALASAVLHGPIDAQAARRLWKLTGGNVLYLRNIVEHEVADGRMVQQNGCWRWIGDPVMPPGLIEMIEARIGELPEQVDDVMDVLSVGEPIELATLTRITGASALEEAEIRGLVALEPAGGGVEVRVAHPLYGEVRRRRAAHTRLRRLRGLLAEALAASADSDDLRVVVRRATLTLDSDLVPDADLLATAAQGAVWLGDLSLADRLADAAARAGAGPESVLLRAHALSWLGCGELAEHLLAGVSGDRLTPCERARWAFLRSSNMLWALADPARAKELIDEASRSTPPEARTYIDAFLAVYWFAMDHPDKAVDASKNLAPEDIPVVGAETAWALAQISADAGRAGEAVAAAEAGYAVATRSLDAPHMVFNIADAHTSALLLAGRIPDALAVAERARRQAAELPGTAPLIGTAVAGRAALAAGDVCGACHLLGQAVEALSGSHPLGWGFRYRIPYATALAMRGATDEAAAALAALDEVPRRFRALRHEQCMARAWTVAGQGAVSEAIALLRSTAESCALAGQFGQEVQCLQMAAQFGDRTTAPRLRELVSLAEGPRAAVAARFAAALHDGDAAELDAVSEAFAQMGDPIAALDAAAHAAREYRRQDRRGSALRCSARADALASRCGVRTPAHRQAGQTLPLTDRETEIVMLIGEGLSNRAVAERLTLSVRTVESHIYRAMSKTGTTSRDELAALLHGD
ncbi:response regulator containing a CheY-like receiver domain and an HTH DNA-binding domain [Mycolicibacterium chubuense NBB4]|uniref:Response regulator containing a CheY-like receiver domain and an HTH DNA-binding domain n=1 Tax=Mycolicibacterium chubuense (strain NBB4) TaxID=710421 RepID=I4BPE1_MYCCN|nr:LuxR family transcriptional regulator [Mycolicibacterium chubuense]AFM19148.1 response regulator containing a CheY-like receiver domain and an HTH DNA-binding domain [Mycolicibacterium chubuense NBB4]